MEEFITQYWDKIIYFVIMVAGAIGSGISWVKTLKSENRIKISQLQTKQDIAITREGIIEAFKNANISPEVKVSISRQVNELLTSFETRFTEALLKREEFRTKLTLMLLKIISNTAAYNKISADTKLEITNLMQEAVKEENLVEIYLPEEE